MVGRGVSCLLEDISGDTSLSLLHVQQKPGESVGNVEMLSMRPISSDTFRSEVSIAEEIRFACLRTVLLSFLTLREKFKTMMSNDLSGITSAPPSIRHTP